MLQTFSEVRGGDKHEGAPALPGLEESLIDQVQQVGPGGLVDDAVAAAMATDGVTITGMS